MRGNERLLLACATAALLCGGHRVAGAPEVRHYGPFHSTSPDSGTCGNFWANDTFDRFFRVTMTPNADGTFDVTEQFKDGSFVTDAGPSPGSCDTNYNARTNGDWKNASADRGGNRGDITGTP